MKATAFIGRDLQLSVCLVVFLSYKNVDSSETQKYTAVVRNLHLLLMGKNVTVIFPPHSITALPFNQGCLNEHPFKHHWVLKPNQTTLTETTKTLY